MENLTLFHILDRKSIRKYQEQNIPEDLIVTLLKAAMNAPSACNQQCWHFVVIEDKEVLSELSSIHGGYLTLKKSPAAILVCGEPDAAKLKSFIDQDLAAATENILIAAKALGLGAVWQGVNPDDKEDSRKISQYVHLPDHIKPFSIVAFGYPAETITKQERFDLNKIHHNIW